MSETRTIEHIRECAEKARDALAEAQGIYAKEHQSPRWEAAKNKWLALKADYHAAIEPEAMLSLLDGIAPTTPPDGDVRMLLVWEAWAKNEGNGAAGLFRRCADRLRSLSVPETRGARSETALKYGLIDETDLRGAWKWSWSQPDWATLSPEDHFGRAIRAVGTRASSGSTGT